MKLLFPIMLAMAFVVALFVVVESKAAPTFYFGGREGGGWYRPAREGGWYRPAREGGWYRPAREGGWYRPAREGGWYYY